MKQFLIDNVVANCSSERSNQLVELSSMQLNSSVRVGLLHSGIYNVSTFLVPILLFKIVEVTSL